MQTKLQEKQFQKICQRGDEIYEFPITRGVYKSGAVDTIADRVLLRRVKKSQYNYCLLITHLVSIISISQFTICVKLTGRLGCAGSGWFCALQLLVSRSLLGHGANSFEVVTKTNLS